MKAITLGKKTFNLSLMSLNIQPRERSKGTNCGNTVMWYSLRYVSLVGDDGGEDTGPNDWQH